MTEIATATNHLLSSLLSLKGKVAVVTGGGGWLGHSMCEVLAELGAQVVIASRDLSKHEKTKTSVDFFADTSKQAKSLKIDLSDEMSVKQCFQSAIDEVGRIDVLINNAYSGQAKSFDETSTQEWESALDIGLTGYFLCTKEAVNYMRSSGGGVIINISSMYGLVSPDFRIYEGTGFSSSPAYGAAKAGVIQFTKYAACALAKDKIRINSLSLGPFPSGKALENEIFVSRLSSKNPMGRIGLPWEVKGAIAFLATDASSFMTGQNLVIDGGWTVW